VTAGDQTIIDKGFLLALRDPQVVEMARQYATPWRCWKARSRDE